MKLDTLFRQPDALPTIPEVVQTLIASFNDDSISIDNITRQIVSDPVLSANLLHLANSAYYKSTNSTTTIPVAIALLGFVNVRTLVISIALKGSFKPIHGLDSKQFWRHSQHTALVARYLAMQAGLDANLAFMLGLIHAIGQPVMYQAMPEKMLKIDQQAPILAPNRIMLEHESLGYSYLEVSAQLARCWKFPEVFPKAITASEKPLEASEFAELAALIHLGAWRSRAEENQLDGAEMARTWPADLANYLAPPSKLALQDFPSWDALGEDMAVLIT
ncbi:MAG: histidine kinase [Betaproteobacteria bacterium HGW-Betaproteobacteria-10]|nr:MAG: histidine kinase [Betaproteobacteria bacterium HGW-Betaproteobacteria-10]